MANIIIVGDGPGGLSAALFLSKNGHSVDVYGLDKTAVNFAYLYNYLGIDEIAGPDFQQKARTQVEKYGVRLRDEQVTAVSATDEGVEATTEIGTTSGDYLILSEGKKPALADSLGLVGENGVVGVDANNRSRASRVYVVGRSVRPARSQAIISAGDGAKAALDILARETGHDVQDWDSPPKG